MPDREDLPELPVPVRDRSLSGGPDVVTLRAWLTAEHALEEGFPLDATVTFLQDRIDEIFGPEALVRFNGFLVEHGRQDSGTGWLLRSEGRLQMLLDHLLVADDDGPEPPEEEFTWTAYGPDDPRGSRHAFRRAVRQQRQNRREALLRPRPPRVAGGRGRSGR